MEPNKSLEEKVKTLQRQMGGFAKLLKDMKCSVENLEKKQHLKEDSDIQEIVEAQQVIDAIIVANSDAIKRIDKEIRDISANKIVKEVQNDIIEERNVDCENVKRKRCRYFNRGFCKYENKCRFSHPDKICNNYSESQMCKAKDCKDRHPKTCKWIISIGGCTREACAYLHTKGEEKANANLDKIYVFKCEGCKHTWDNEKHVVGHVINHRRVYFCLNCDDWIEYKSEVFNEGQTLLN